MQQTIGPIGDRLSVFNGNGAPSLPLDEFSVVRWADRA